MLRRIVSTQEGIGLRLMDRFEPILREALR
jgi:hypothetical protein